MIFDRVAEFKTANQILNESKIIPKKAMEFVNDFGTKIYCFNENFKPSTIGLTDKEAMTDDGRKYDDTSSYWPKYNAIFIHQKDLEIERDEIAFSTIIHEFGHALDLALGNKLGKDTYLSCIEPGIFKRWRDSKALDYYGNINTVEYFAEAFMAYCYKGLENYKPWSYREHTISELKNKDSDMLYFFDSILGDIHV